LADDRELGERVRALEVRDVATQADIADIFVLIQGPPWERSLRGRVHELETSHVAASAAEAALAIAKELRSDRWSVKAKALTLVIALLAVGSPWAMFFLAR
jgi:hypothetical protein